MTTNDLSQGKNYLKMTVGQIDIEVKKMVSPSYMKANKLLQKHNRFQGLKSLGIMKYFKEEHVLTPQARELKMKTSEKLINNLFKTQRTVGESVDSK